MADVFISHASSDAEIAHRFAEAFRAEGLEVWWDKALQAGDVFDEAIEQALRAAKAVVVLWSPNAVASRWVRAEATLADRNRTLVPATVSRCNLPIVFELTQTPDLSHWHGDKSDPTWRAFLADVRRLVDSNAVSSAPAEGKPPSTADGISIVVLPFANMSRDEDQEYFADGVTEDIITDLSKVSALAVIARNTAFTFKGKAVDITDVARQLGVSHVLEGSVRKVGIRVRVTAQLIDGATGSHVWAERWDRDLDDIFQLQDELSEAIVGVLKVKLLPSEKQAIEERLTDSAEAYDYYIRARALRAFGGVDNMLRAIDAYRKAVALDPNFAAAWAGLASAHALNPWFASKLSANDPVEMQRALARAMELAPNSIDVVASRSFVCVYAYDWDEIEACLSFWNSHDDAKWTVHAALLSSLGLLSEACDRQAAVCRSDPLSAGASFVYQHMLDCAGQLDQGEAEYQRIRHFPFGNRELHVRAIMRQMAFGDAAEAARRFRLEFGNDSSVMPYAPALAEVFDSPEGARELLAAARMDSACQAQSAQGLIALWAGYFGDPDTAFSALRSATVDRRGIIHEVWNPAFRPYRGDPRFKQILIDVGLADHWRKTGRWGEFVRPTRDGDFEIAT